MIGAPAQTQVTRDGYDPADFRPYLTAIPVRDGTEVKGAVVLLAGGAFQARANYTDTLPTAAHLRELGFQTFIVDYRLRPYTQQEGALDVARAVRFIRKNADVYGIDPNDIAVMGYSAGGIQAGEFLLNFDEDVLPTALDPDYIPDELDEVSAHASAAGMIYSFYGRLSVASMDADELRSGNLPPTFYCYGTEDPFYRQFEAQYDLMQEVGVLTKRIVLQDWPHGFGGDGGWVEDYAQWLEMEEPEEIFIHFLSGTKGRMAYQFHSSCSRKSRILRCLIPLRLISNSSRVTTYLGKLSRIRS